MLCCFFLLLAGTDKIHAQNISLNWAKSIGAGGYDNCYGLAVDASGNTYITGQFSGTVDFDPGAGTANLTSNSGGFDIFIAKYDPSGGYLWAKGFGSTGSDFGNDIVVDASGNVYMVGQFRFTIDFDPGTAVANLTAIGSRDIVLAKYSTNGDYVWAKNMGGTYESVPHAIALDATGNIYIAGEFFETVDFNPGPGTANLTSNGPYNDIFFAKYDNAGNYIWAKGIGGTNLDIAYDIAVDNSGNVYVAGDFRTTTDFDPGPGITNLSTSGASDENVFLSKYDASGNFIWAKNLGSTGTEIVFSLVLDPAGNAYIAGGYDGTADFDPGAGTANLTAQGNMDIYLARYDSNGNYVWAKSMGGTGNDMAMSMARTPTGDLYISGYFSNTADFDPGTAISNLVSAGNLDIFAAKYSDAGDYLWAGRMGGATTDLGYNIATGATGNVYVAGEYTSTADFDPGAATTNLSSVAGSPDIFLVRLSDGCPSSSSLTVTECDSLVFNGTTYTASGTFTNTMTSSFGCDSIVTINLTIHHAAANPVVTGSYCDSATFNGISYTATGIYTQHYTNLAGCDSNFTYDITITGQSSASVLTQTVCDSLVFNGAVYTASGTYVSTFTNATGCDSLVTINLTVNSSPEASVIQSGTTLTAGSADSYQWINCATSAPIAGATAQMYMPAVTGSYAVVVFSNDCSDTSACITVDAGTGISELGVGNALQLYPNPSRGQIVIQSQQALQQVSIRLLSITGALLEEHNNLQGTQFRLNMAAYARGMYLVEIADGSNKARLKVTRE